jgi:hypothetical protein
MRNLGMRNLGMRSKLTYIIVWVAIVIAVAEALRYMTSFLR